MLDNDTEEDGNIEENLVTAVTVFYTIAAATSCPALMSQEEKH